MPTLLIRLPARRYHGTPTGHHVNEGQIEWPPSPWRLLRALLACGYNTLGWEGDLRQPMANQPPSTASALILKLAEVLPSYHLPAAIGAHSRHYMPLAQIEKGREKTTLVFDTWAHLADQTLAVTWNIDLSAEEQQLLATLAERLGYLGRSESWTEVRLATADDDLPLPNCVPTDELANPGPGWEQIPVLAPQPAAAFGNWREQAVSRVLAPFEPPPGKKITKSLLAKRDKAAAPYPIDLIACLQADTTWLRSHGWSQAPGSRRVFYWRASDSLEAGAPTPRAALRKAAAVEAMLLSLATETGNDHALPAITRTLPQAELLHRALGRQIKQIAGHSPVISGCDAQGRPLKGLHQHAHILPLDLDGDQHIEHILIWAPMGLDEAAQTAVRATRRTWTKGSVGNLKVALAAAGDLANLRGLPGRLGQSISALTGPPEGTHRWMTVTPFVAPRFIKRNGKNSLAGQITAELLARGHPAPVEVHRHDPWIGEVPKVQLLTEGTSGSGQGTDVVSMEWVRFRHFVRTRRKGPEPPVDCGFAIELVFAEPVRGPICLGYGSHFGLGVFRAVLDQRSWRGATPQDEAIVAS